MGGNFSKLKTSQDIDQPLETLEITRVRVARKRDPANYLIRLRDHEEKTTPSILLKLFHTHFGQTQINVLSPLENLRQVNREDTESLQLKISSNFFTLLALLQAENATITEHQKLMLQYKQARFIVDLFDLSEVCCLDLRSHQFLGASIPQLQSLLADIVDAHLNIIDIMFHPLQRSVITEQLQKKIERNCIFYEANQTLKLYNTITLPNVLACFNKYLSFVDEARDMVFERLKDTLAKSRYKIEPQEGDKDYPKFAQEIMEKKRLELKAIKITLNELSTLIDNPLSPQSCLVKQRLEEQNQTLVSLAEQDAPPVVWSRNASAGQRSDVYRSLAADFSVEKSQLDNHSSEKPQSVALRDRIPKGNFRRNPMLLWRRDETSSSFGMPGTPVVDAPKAIHYQG